MIHRLQIQQNKALRVVTRNHSNASWDHLCNEAQTLPMKDKCELYCTHFLASASRPQHPSYPTAWDLPIPRPDGWIMKQTLATKVGPIVRPHLEADGTILDANLPRVRSRIHSANVGRSLRLDPFNRLLNARRPKINLKLEAELV